MPVLRTGAYRPTSSTGNKTKWETDGVGKREENEMRQEEMKRNKCMLYEGEESAEMRLHEMTESLCKKLTGWDNVEINWDHMRQLNIYRLWKSSDETKWQI